MKLQSTQQLLIVSTTILKPICSSTIHSKNSPFLAKHQAFARFTRSGVEVANKVPATRSGINAKFEEIFDSDVVDTECLDYCDFEEVREFSEEDEAFDAEGYYSNKTRQCYDLSPCSAQGTEICVNKWAARNCVCKLGFKGESCELDVDECTLVREGKEDEAVCGANSVCVNKPGSYDCECLNGYDRSEWGVLKFPKSTDCTDIDECMIESEVCGAHGTCSNTDGGYECSCADGWLGVNCDQDVDECLQEDICGEHGTCKNEDGGFSCVCDAGITGENCDQDYDECWTNTCDTDGYTHATCQNTFGSYICECWDGFEGEMCENDTDECMVGNVCGIEFDCVNTLGSFECVMPETTPAPTTLAPTTLAPTTQEPTTLEPTTPEQTTVAPTTPEPTTVLQTTTLPKIVIETPIPELNDFMPDLDYEQAEDCHADHSETDYSETDYSAPVYEDSLPEIKEKECAPGFTGDDCLEDINECFQEFLICGIYASCRNFDGGFECDCHAGFEKNLEGECAPRDEPKFEEGCEENVELN